MGLGPFTVWRKVRIVQKQCPGKPMQASCHSKLSGPVPPLEKEMWFTSFWCEGGGGVEERGPPSVAQKWSPTE